MKKLTLLITGCIFALVIHVSQAAEVWIQWGTTTNGAGTMADPKVVSSASEFDAYMNSQPEDATIHLLAGEFLTAGLPDGSATPGVVVKKGQKIRGAGIDSTIVKIASGGTGYLMAFNPTNAVLQHRAEISDMTIDCNLQGQTSPANCSGAALWGSDTRLSRIKVINWGSTSGECFVMRLGYWDNYHSQAGQGDQFATNCIIEEVVITQPGPVAHQDGTTAIQIVGLPIDNLTGPYPAQGPTFNVPSPGWVRGAVVRGCQLINIHAGSAGNGKPTYFQGFGVGAGTENLKLHDNYAIDLGGPSSRTIYSEEAYFRNVAIENNFFVDVSCAYFFNSTHTNSANYMRENLAIRDNYIVLRNDENAMTAIGFYILHCKINNLTIANNYIVGGLGDIPSSRTAISIGDSALNLSVEDNVIDAPGTNGYDLSITGGTTLSSFQGNRRQDGSEISYAPFISPINGAAEVVFTPSQVGWYRLWQGCNYATARVLIDAGDINNTITSLDFSFEMGGTAGLVNLHRHIPYSGSAISKIRTAYDLPPMQCRLHYLEVQQVNGTTPIRVRFQDGGLHTMPLSLPTFLTSSPTPPAAVEERILNLGTGFRTSGALFSANTQITDDVSGKILPGALPNLPIASFNSGTGASANTFWRGDGTWAEALLQETVEQSSSPVNANVSTTVPTTIRFFDFHTLPTTEKFYVITGIEWKNGNTVAGNTICGAVLVNMVPPTQNAVPTVAFGQLTANANANSPQRVSRIVSQPIRGGTMIGVFIHADNASHTYSTATVANANNRKSSFPFPAQGNVANQDAVAWVAHTTKPYIKVYYQGYK